LMTGASACQAAAGFDAGPNLRAGAIICSSNKKTIMYVLLDRLKRVMH
jgi:hypothetical protein